MTKTLGTYQKGEVPEPLTYTFRDADGALLDLTGYSSVTWWWRTPAGTDSSVAASITGAATGLVEATWTAAMTAAVGVHTGVFWLAPGPVPSVTLVWSVIDGPGPT